MKELYVLTSLSMPEILIGSLVLILVIFLLYALSTLPYQADNKIPPPPKPKTRKKGSGKVISLQQRSKNRKVAKH